VDGFQGEADLGQLATGFAQTSTDESANRKRKGPDRLIRPLRII
jgi:hypothetical protein